MNEKTIRKLVKLVEESDVDQIEVSSWWRKIRITRRLTIDGRNGNPHPATAVREVAMAPAPASKPPAPPPHPSPEPQPAVESKAPDADKKYVEVKSPMVGTFYAAPAPDARPYVTEGQHIEVGQVVCIVEAMKLMNEIESEVSGRIVKIMLENAQPVEFGQVMFLIDPNG
jgi:acetyl-CoA carboxylase biotin carboxyl carrier protein